MHPSVLGALVFVFGPFEAGESSIRRAKLSQLTVSRASDLSVRLILADKSVQSLLLLR